LHPRRPGRFAIYLRTPGWSRASIVEVNDYEFGLRPRPGAWVRLEREWRDGDLIRFQMVAEVSVRRWPTQQDAASIHRGPLTFALPIRETKRLIGGNDAWPEFELLPSSRWNYGLVLRRGSVRANEDVDWKSPPTFLSPHIEIETIGRAIAAWSLQGGL